MSFVHFAHFIDLLSSFGFFTLFIFVFICNMLLLFLMSLGLFVLFINNIFSSLLMLGIFLWFFVHLLLWCLSLRSLLLGSLLFDDLLFVVLLLRSSLCNVLLRLGSSWGSGDSNLLSLSFSKDAFNSLFGKLLLLFLLLWSNNLLVNNMVLLVMVVSLNFR